MNARDIHRIMFQLTRVQRERTNSGVRNHEYNADNQLRWQSATQHGTNVGRTREVRILPRDVSAVRWADGIETDEPYPETDDEQAG